MYNHAKYTHIYTFIHSHHTFPQLSSTRPTQVYTSPNRCTRTPIYRPYTSYVPTSYVPSVPTRISPPHHLTCISVVHQPTNLPIRYPTPLSYTKTQKPPHSHSYTKLVQISPKNPLLPLPLRFHAKIPTPPFLPQFSTQNWYTFQAKGGFTFRTPRRAGGIYASVLFFYTSCTL